MKQTHTGACHCGAVRFQFEADLTEGGSRCNCTICTKTNIFGRSVKPDAFRLLQGERSLAFYEWATKIGKRYFCKTCGVQCYGSGHLAELGGDFVSVNLNCLEGVELDDLAVVYWDGRHNAWDAGPRPTPWPIFREGEAKPASSSG
jgi:hypothetical protein